MRAKEFLSETKTLDPDIFGGQLPTATVKKIVSSTFSQVDPTANLSFKYDVNDGYYTVTVTDEQGNTTFSFVFGISVDDGSITASIHEAFASAYRGKGIVQSIIGQCFRAAEKKFGTPREFVINPYEDRGHGVWQHIANKLGARYEANIKV